MKKKLLVSILLLVLGFTLACTLTNMSSSNEAMESTAVALQATQVALEMKILELAQQQTAIAQPPEDQDTQSVAPEDDRSEVVFEDVRFLYDSAIAGSVAPSVEPQMEDIVGVIPEHIEFVFNDYAWGGSMHTPAIYIYSVDAYRAANEYINESINDLDSLLRDRPENPDSVPFLPVWNAGQMFASNVEYLDFENGTGVRFLTQYGQAIYPVNNNGLFYTFQGMTSDGQWYVAAVFPAANPFLPATGDDIPGGDWETFGNNYESHINDMKNLLQSQPDDSFTPALNLLDDVVRSLRVK